MSVERIEIAPGFSISRIIKGGWQLSAGHSASAGSDPVEDMFAFADAGVTTFDCADIYTGVEELIGRFLSERKKRRGSHEDIQVLTKFVPDYDALPTLNKQYVERIIDRSLKRLGVERLDMVQFSWWTYDVPGWVEAANWLGELQQAGKIRLISGTNFNTKSTREILQAGVRLTTLQVQYSVLDNRPEKGLVDLCRENNIHLLCYGTVAGGFLSDRWLGDAEPLPPYENRSQVKYRLMIEEFGSWVLFQELLRTLHGIAEKHHTSLANVATRYILERPQVGAAIIGARTAVHLNENLGVFDFSLDASDVDAIRKLMMRRRGPAGDVFDLERIKEGPHGSMMKYNLNQLSS
ncbi:MAG: aldo/keto reductase [Cyclobacteriaceae bacterium]|nr:aldo/keto reductase [Cyclobacteriaceae bacterium]